MEEKYEREIISMLSQLERKTAALKKDIEFHRGTKRSARVLTTGSLNAAQELTSLSSDVERAIYIVLSARKEKK